MAVGDRIKRVRNFRGMTMKELGMAVGFDEKSADVRIAQYENNSRKPKEELMRKIAAALDVSVAYLEDPTMNDAEGILHALFELDDQYPWMHLVETVDNTDADLPHKRVAVCFDYNILDSFMAEWMLRKQQLRRGEITREEYQEWKLNWPSTADDCGKFQPKKAWRKESRHEKPSEPLPFRRAFSCLPQILKNKTESIKFVSFGL